MIRISDQTLRDGEQQVGIVFAPKQKIELAWAIAKTGVDYIALMPVTCDEEYDITKVLQNQSIPVVPDMPLKKESVKQVKSLGTQRITLFTSVSDILLEAKGLSHKQNVMNALEIVTYAFQNNLIVDFAFEDASRADIGYITELALELKPFINYLILCDTVGCLQPNLTEIWIRQFIKKSTCLKIGIHCHNDLGLAVENTIRAVLSGSTLISGTFTGIGERAGNAALEQVLTQLRLKHNIQCEQINYDKIDSVCQLVRDCAGRGPVKPLSDQAFYCETGIHVYAMLRNEKAYSVLPNKQPEIWFGKFSGISNYRWLFERILNQQQPEATYSMMRDKVKILSIKEKKSFSTNEIIQMYIKGFFSDCRLNNFLSRKIE